MKKFNKKKLPSRHTSLGPDKAPQRSFYYAMNLTEKDVAEACMQTGYKFSPRLHISLFGNAWGT